MQSQDLKMPIKKIKLFYVCAQEDSALTEELEKHVYLLKRQGIIESWYPARIPPGEIIDTEVARRLDDADIILLLVSSDFIASSSCYDVQMLRAIERHKEGTALVIPILLRAVDLTGSPFSSLKALPSDQKPIVSYEDRDLVWSEVSQSIRTAAFARFLVNVYSRDTRIYFNKKSVIVGVLAFVALLLFIIRDFLR